MGVRLFCGELSSEAAVGVEAAAFIEQGVDLFALLARRAVGGIEPSLGTDGDGGRFSAKDGGTCFARVAHASRYVSLPCLPLVFAQLRFKSVGVNQQQ